MNPKKSSFFDIVKKNSLPLLLALGLTAVLSFAGGYLLKLDSTVPVWVCVGFLILLVAYSFISSQHLISKMKHRSVRDIHEQALADKEKASSDFQHYMKVFSRELYAFYIWIFICALLTMLLCFLSAGSSSVNFKLFTATMIICFYIFWGMFAWIIPTETHVLQDYHPISADEFPILYQMVSQIFSEEKLPPILLYGNADRVTAIRYGKRIYIQIGAFLAGIMTKDELKQILWHEKGNIVTAEEDPQLKIFRTLDLHPLPSEHSILLFPLDFLIFSMLRKLNVMADLYESSLSAEIERRADLYACAHGKASLMASSMMKTKMLQLYQTYEDEIQGCYYKAKTTPTNVLIKDLKKFRKAYRLRKDFWKDLILHEQSPAIDSRPYFAERYANIGKPRFGLRLPKYFDSSSQNSTAETDSSSDTSASAENTAPVSAATDLYTVEIQNLIRKYCQLHYDLNKDGYSDRRKENWLKPLKNVKKYQEEAEAGKDHSPAELRDIISDCYRTNEFELMEELCRKVIDSSESSHEKALAHFYLGVHQLHCYDKEGIDHLYQAVDGNDNYFEEASELLSEFLLLMNMEKEINEYHEWHITKLQKQIDKDYDAITYIHKRDHLSAETTLSPEKQNANIIYIRYVTGEHLLRLYQVHKVTRKGLHATIYVVEYDDKVSIEESAVYMTKIYEFLSQQDEEYSLLDWYDVQGFKVGELPGLVYEKIGA